MAHILTNYPPKAKKINEFGSECPQLKIPVEIEDRVKRPVYHKYIYQFWWGVIMKVVYHSSNTHPNKEDQYGSAEDRIVAVWRLKELKPQRITFEEQEKIHQQFKDKYTS